MIAASKRHADEINRRLAETHKTLDQRMVAAENAAQERWKEHEELTAGYYTG